MDANRLKEGLEKLKGMLGKPVKLSATEKAKFAKVIEQFKELLDENYEIMLEMERDNAYRYLNLLIAAFQEADAKFAGGVEAPELIEDSIPVSIPPEEQDKMLEEAIKQEGYPPFRAILDSLEVGERGQAKGRLDCVKSALQLEEDGHNPDQVMCNDAERRCSVVEMRKCLRTADPTIDPSQDIIDEVDEARAKGELPRRPG